MRQTAEETEALKTLILEKAREVFSNKGYSSTKMQDIAVAANVSRGPLYYHYANKIELFNSVLEYSCREQYDALSDIFSRNIPFKEMLREDLLFVTRDNQLLFYSMTRTMFDQQAEEFYTATQILAESLSDLYKIKLTAAEKAVKQGELKSGADLNRMINLLFLSYDMFTGNVQHHLLNYQKDGMGLSNEDIISFVLNSLQKEFFASE